MCVCSDASMMCVRVRVRPLQAIYHKDFSGIMKAGATMTHPLAGIDGLKSLLDPRVSMGPPPAPEHTSHTTSRLAATPRLLFCSHSCV